MSSSTIPIRGQIGVTATRRPGEPWSMVYRRAVGELLDLSRRRGADGLVALSPAWIAGDKLRITAHPRER
ncbi:MAG TPA: hypothetical protein VGS60_13675 [Actinomycetes bacterium]|nr:hypothetical protein [Actinomycetes bacterium]